MEGNGGDRVGIESKDGDPEKRGNNFSLELVATIGRVRI